MRRKRRLRKSIKRLLCLLVVLLLVGGGGYMYYDHKQQQERHETAEVVYKTYQDIQTAINELPVSDYVTEESFEEVRKLANEEIAKDYKYIKQFHNYEDRIEDETIAKISALPKPTSNKFYRLMKLADKMKEEAQYYYNFVLLEPQDRIDYTLEYEHVDDYLTAPDALSESLDQVPALLQWDTRWGFIPYGDMRISFNACAPTSLSMVFSYLNQDPTITPAAIAALSEQQNTYVLGVGTSHALLEIAAQKYGIQVAGFPVSSDNLAQALHDGKICVLSVVPGDFTQVGHFIVVYGIEGNQLLIRDPNSKIRTNQKWDIDRVINQTSAIWAYSK